MSRKILTYISPSMYNLILKEKKKLQDKEKNKVKSRRRVITMIIASNSIARRVK